MKVANSALYTVTQASGVIFLISHVIFLISLLASEITEDIRYDVITEDIWYDIII